MTVPHLPAVDPMHAQAAEFLRVCRGEVEPPTGAAEAAEDLHLVSEMVRMRMALNLRPDSAISSGTVIAVARRYWWVSSLVLLLVALVAGARLRLDRVPLDQESPVCGSKK
jgi:hypothetical protein